MNWQNRSAYVFIKTEKGKAEEVWKKFHTWENVIGTWIVTGEWDVIVWFDAQDLDTIHRYAAEIKKWNEIEHTSSHMVYNGYKNDTWWWEKPAGTWVLIRENNLDETPDKIKRWDWLTSGASIPGDWDYITWAGGNNWDEVWNHVMEMKSWNWQTSTYVPIKSWWNHNWKNNWW